MRDKGPWGFALSLYENWTYLFKQVPLPLVQFLVCLVSPKIREPSPLYLVLSTSRWAFCVSGVWGKPDTTCGRFFLLKSFIKIPRLVVLSQNSGGTKVRWHQSLTSLHFPLWRAVGFPAMGWLGLLPLRAAVRERSGQELLVNFSFATVSLWDAMK